MITAITTSPRQTNYLADCVASLQRAGANDIRIFAEPDSDLTGIVFDEPNKENETQSATGCSQPPITSDHHVSKERSDGNSH